MKPASKPLHLSGIGALLLMSAVAAGAFGAHALRGSISPALLATWQTAVLYQLVHGLGLLLLAALANRLHAAWLRRAARLMLAGVLLFSGSLYILVLSGQGWIGAVTPLGGVLLISSWALVAVASWCPSAPSS